MARGPGIVQRKILLLLLGGLALGLSGSPRRYFRILKMIGNEWRSIERAQLWKSIQALYRSKLIWTRRHPDGSYTLVLSEKGRTRALTYQLETMRIPVLPVWDKKWRIVLFDIPQKRHHTRDIFRTQLKQIGFREFQKSAFICPYPCADEVEFLIEMHDIRRHVRLVTADAIDTDIHVRQRFGI